MASVSRTNPNPNPNPNPDPDPDPDPDLPMVCAHGRAAALTLTLTLTLTSQWCVSMGALLQALRITFAFALNFIRVLACSDTHTHAVTHAHMQ